MSAVPEGVSLRPLTMHEDERGVFTEVFRREWELGLEPVQWNVVHSEAGVLRGVHVHPHHDDYLVLVRGHACVGLRDLRRDSPSEGLAVTVDLDAREVAGIVIPHGVAHGFYFREESTHLYAVSHYWDADDEQTCLWSDPALEIPWPVSTARVSERDGDAPPLSGLIAALAPLQPL